MAVETTPKEVEVNIDVPLTNIVQGQKQTFYGKVKVSQEIADDLKRREHEYHEYEKSLIRNNGRMDVNAGSVVGNQGN